MTVLQAVILGLVQGLTEFLPVSSSGHLALLQNFFGIESGSVLLFTIMLHIGTLVSVFVVYWRDILGLIIEFIEFFADLFTGKGIRIDCNPMRKLLFLIIAASIPTAIIGLLFEDFFESLYSTPVAIAIGLIITGTLLFVIERISSGDRTIKDIGFRHAFLVGVFQGIAICPGISRSGSTLAGGLISGLKRKIAVKFAFLISIPSILGSALLELPDALEQGIDKSLAMPMLIGIIVAAVSGFAAIKLMIRLVSNKKLFYFSIYTWALGALVLILTLLR